MSFSEFYQRSINEPEQFWAEQARRIDWQTPFTQTLDHSNPPFARWFCEGRTNLCHNAIDRWLEKQPEALALIAVSSETEEERTFTFRQLHDEVNAVASMLRSLGVQRGDRVLVYMPMIAEAHITLLACARIGAIHSVVFGGFASHSVAARIDDAKPVLIVSADAGARGGKIIPYKKLLDDAISQAQHQPRHVCWWIAGWRKWRASAGGMSISRRCAINTSARGYRWRGWNPTKPPAFSTLPARPANLKACSVTSADMRWRWRPRWTPFLAAKRAACSFAHRISAGWWGIRISFTRRCWRDGDYRLRRIADLAGLRRVVENRREISG
ncbi:propionate--coA ligase [Escherichia coli]|nr:propionate--coA ligase [Escherichia coli]